MVAESENKASAHAYFEDLWNQADLEAADRIFAPDVQFNYPMGAMNGTEAVKRYVGVVHTAFPDIRFEIHDLFGEGERFACRWTLKGTQTGEFRGNAPSGRKVVVPGNTVFAVRDGKIHELWIAFDPTLFIQK